MQDASYRDTHTGATRPTRQRRDRARTAQARSKAAWVGSHAPRHGSPCPPAAARPAVHHGTQTSRIPARAAVRSTSERTRTAGREQRSHSLAPARAAPAPRARSYHPVMRERGWHEGPHATVHTRGHDPGRAWRRALPNPNLGAQPPWRTTAPFDHRTPFSVTCTHGDAPALHRPRMAP